MSLSNKRCELGYAIHELSVIYLTRATTAILHKGKFLTGL